MRGGLGGKRSSPTSSSGRCPRKKASSPQHPRARGALQKIQGYREKRPSISHLPQFFRPLSEIVSRSFSSCRDKVASPARVTILI